MKYLDYITGFINKSVSDAVPCNHMQILGLAQPVRTVKDDKTVTWPASYIGKGDMVYAGFDDKYGMCSYHRALNMLAERAPGQTYGDNPGNVRLSHRMTLVMFANREKIGMSADQLALLMQFSIPERMGLDTLPKDFSSVIIRITDVVLSEEQVFNEEFRNVEFFLGPEHVLLKCNYTIESVLNKRCFNMQCQSDD